MNMVTLQKRAYALETVMKKASRALLEFEVAQSEWEIGKGLVKSYSSAKALIRDVTRKPKRA